MHAGSVDPQRPVRRRWIVGGIVALIPAGLVLAGGHAGVHAARSMALPGAGLIEASTLAAVVSFVAATGAAALWLRWGADWALVVTVAGVMVASAMFGTSDHGSAIAVDVAAHEFPLVIVIVGALCWLRATLGGLPGFGWLRGPRRTEPRQLLDLAPVDRARAVAIAALTAGDHADLRAAIDTDDVRERARTVGLVARGRRGGDPFRNDHAHARAALCLTGVLDDPAIDRFADDALRNGTGVPTSEPTWIRPLDATLAAVALHRAGRTEAGVAVDRLLAGPLRLRRGHRPAWYWTGLGLAAGRCHDWEHAAATAIARANGWCGDEDWMALRRRVLGAAARGVGRRDDERLIAAGRVWLTFVDDEQARRIVARPTVGADPVAAALDSYATSLASPALPTPLGGGR